MGTGACVLAGDGRAMGAAWTWATGAGRSRSRQAAEQQSCSGSMVQERARRARATSCSGGAFGHLTGRHRSARQGARGERGQTCAE